MNSVAFSFDMRETKRAYADLKETPPNKHATDGGTIAAGLSTETTPTAPARIPAVAATTKQKPTAPRRPSPFAQRGSWAPSLLCTDATHAVSRVPRLVAFRPHSLRDASPRSKSSPPGRFRGRRPFSTVHHCPVPALPLTHSPRREVVQWCRITRGVPTPRLLGVTKEWRCFCSRPCFGS